MEELTAAGRATLHAALLRMRDELTATQATTQGLAGTVHLDQTAVGRVSRGDALQAQAMAAEQVRRNALRLKQVAVALAAVDDGSYGDCRVCGEPIGFARLSARPETPACVPCMAELERG